MARFVVLCLLGLFSSLHALGQQAPVSDPQALSFAAQSVAAITGGATINDVTLSGSVTWNGADTGTATLSALGIGESRMDLALTSGTRTEIRDAQTGVPLGQWFAPNNTSGYFASHNCWTDAVWFFPALGSLASGPNVVLSYIGQEDRNGASVQHIQSYLPQAAQSTGIGPQQFSTTDFYLDTATLLPVAAVFNMHPDADATTNILVEVDFDNYQVTNGVTVPMHIQKYQQGNLLGDITISGVSLNTGLPLSSFTIN